MKFLCDNCKAKYQIGDDKVAGKTVRMKCRRCGHLIEVSASVTETSVARAPEPAEAAVAEPAPTSAAREKTPTPPPSAASSELREDDADERTMIMSGPPVKLGAPRPAPAPGPTPLRAVPRAPSAGPALRSVPSPSPRPVPVAGPGRAAAVAAAPRPIDTPKPAPVGESNIRALDAPLGIVPKPAEKPAAPASGVAGAFQRALAQPATTAARGTPSEDWYVGIGGVPLGPIRLAVIREKAAAGAVDGDSLVWREGFDEWQPLKNFPELLEIVTEAQNARASRRPSAVVPAPAPSSPSAIPAPRPSAPVAAPPSSPSAIPAPPAAPASSPSAVPAPPVVAASASSPSAIPVAASSAPTAVDPPKPSDTSKPSADPLAVLADPFAAPPPASQPAPKPLEPLAKPAASPASIVPDEPPLPPARRGMHPAAYAFIAMAGLFGAVAAYVTLMRPAPSPQVIYVPGSTVVIQAPPSAAPSESAQAEAPAPSSEPSGAVAKSSTGGAVGGAAHPSGEAKSAASSAPAANIDMAGFSGSSIQGPSATGPSGSSGNAGGQLSAGEISGVVSSNQPIIRRKCWQPALDAHSKDGPTHARVSAHLVIGPNGSVQSVSAGGGEKDFPGLSSCIASRIKSWKFPPSSGSTPVDVPFVFAGQ